MEISTKVAPNYGNSVFKHQAKTFEIKKKKIKTEKTDNQSDIEDITALSRKQTTWAILKLKHYKITSLKPQANVQAGAFMKPLTF